MNGESKENYILIDFWYVPIWENKDDEFRIGPKKIYIESGKSPGDFWSSMEEINKNNEAMSKESEEVYIKFLAALRKYENKTGWFRPDLSYFPEKE